MRERPILFSGPMVRALLAGTKTQTRRVVKPQPSHFIGGPGITDEAGNPWPREPAIDEQSCSLVIRCPYGQPGDRLWVREAFAHHVHALSAHSDDDGPWVYAADPFATHHRLGDRWRPSIHMPRVASRITLEVTAVRVERLQEISEADAKAEGVAPDAGVRMDDPVADFRRIGPVKGDSFPIARYAALWESINGAGSWDLNPWVWVVEFRRVNAASAEAKEDHA